MFGAAARTGGRRTPQPVRRSTRYMTNSYHIASELDKRCDKTHTHQKGTGNECNKGTQHPQGTYRAICRGLIKEKRNGTEGLCAVAEVHPGKWPTKPVRTNLRIKDPEEYHEALDEEIRLLTSREENTAYDDVTGLPLDRQRVLQARAEEIEHVRNKAVWERIPRAEAQRK